MDEGELARRKALQAAIANLGVEAGFTSMEKDALGTLTEIAQSYIVELGRTARVYSELASRTDPTASDVHMALIDAGADINSLTGYAKRTQRRHLPRQMRNFPAPQPKSLAVGTKAQRPSNVPSHLPAFPDPHTYIKTPVFTSPASDYKPVREKLASQKRNSKKGLSTLLAKTRPSRPVAGKEDRHGVYTVVQSPSPSLPLYLQALMPSPEDGQDGLASEDDQKSMEQEGPLVEQADPQVGDSPAESMELSEGSTQAETFENPFLKPPKRIKLKIL